jgi:hypothetical protein
LPPLHGTAQRFLESIRKEGLKPGARQYVHLSEDVDTATTVILIAGLFCFLQHQRLRPFTPAGSQGYGLMSLISER